MVPASTAVLPDGFRVNNAGSELIISWGIQGYRKASAVVLAILCLLLLLVFRSDSSTLVLCGLLLLGSVYWLIAMFANRTIVRATEREWVVWRGPVPLPTRDYFRSRKRIDPSCFTDVVALQDPNKKYSWGHISDLGDLLFELVLWLGHTATRASRVTYTLYGQTREGTRTELLGSIRKEHASALKQRLEELLPSGVRPVREQEEDMGRDEVEKVLPTSGGAIQRQATDAPSVTTAAGPGPGGSQDAPPWPVCPECGGTNPPGSAFCGECGTGFLLAAA